MSIDSTNHDKFLMNGIDDVSKKSITRDDNLQNNKVSENSDDFSNGSSYYDNDIFVTEGLAKAAEEVGAAVGIFSATTLNNFDKSEDSLGSEFVTLTEFDNSQLFSDALSNNINDKAFTKYEALSNKHTPVKKSSYEAVRNK